MTFVFEYLNLPKIPEYLLDDLVKIESQENLYGLKTAYYKQFEINKELNDYLKSIFNFDFSVQYQVIRKGIPIHKDRSRIECINYLIDNGGETSFLEIYDEDKITLLAKEQIENFRWHRINVSKFHGVSGLSFRPRVSVTITPTDKKF